jgi:D-arabinonate dehydratase
MAHVRARTTIPINAGQSEISPEGVRRLLDANAVDIVNFDASEGGGPTAWRRAAAACALAGVKLAHHEEPQIAAHMLGGVAGGTFLECFADPERDPLWREIYNRPPIVNGRSRIPTGPGFGIQLNWELVNRYRL